jgi:PEP-CTERM motif
MNAHFPMLGVLAAALACWLTCPTARADPIPVTLKAPYTQNFDSLANTKEDQAFTWTNDSTIPGWFASLGTYRVSNGSNNNAGLYSFGSFKAKDRALGAITGITITPIFFGATFQNKTNAIITDLKVEYTGEQWRDANTNPQTLLFTIQGNPVKQLNFTSPTNNGGSVKLDGNAAANRTPFVFTIANLAINPDANFDVQWTLNNPKMGLSQGLAVDDFKLTVVGTKAATPEPSTLVLLAVGAAVALGARRRRRGTKTASLG